MRYRYAIVSTDWSTPIRVQKSGIQCGNNNVWLTADSSLQVPPFASGFSTSTISGNVSWLFLDVHMSCHVISCHGKSGNYKMA